MRPFRGLLLDSDGTLVNSVAPTETAWGEWAARHDLDADGVRRACHGVPGPQTVEAWAPQLDPVAEAKAVEQRELELAGEVSAYPGAADLLGHLDPACVALVTSAPPPLAAARFEGAGLTLPAVVVTPVDVERGKPDPAPYLVGAERLGLAPEDCLVVEDAPAGVVAGVAAGCQVVAVAQTHDADELGAADEVFADLAALLRALA